MRLSVSHVKSLVQEAAPDAEWKPEAVVKLGELGEAHIARLAAEAFGRRQNAGGVRVQADDVQPPVDQSHEVDTLRRQCSALQAELEKKSETGAQAYVGWLEEVNEAFARALRAAGVDPATVKVPKNPVKELP